MSCSSEGDATTHLANYSSHSHFNFLCYSYGTSASRIVFDKLLCSSNAVEASTHRAIPPFFSIFVVAGSYFSLDSIRKTRNKCIERVGGQ